MLIYLMAFYVISSCDSTPRRTYAELVLIQRFPITQFFYRHLYSRYVQSHSDELITYLADHKFIFKTQSWIIFGLWAYNSNGRLLTACVDSSGSELTLNLTLLDDDLKQSLKTKWPSLIVRGNEEEDWAMDYHDFGSCVTEDAVLYFRKGLELLEHHDVGIILSNAKIYPGNFYTLNNITESVTTAVGKRVQVKCIRPPGSDKQYLSEIRICYNTTYEVVDCEHQHQLNIRPRDLCKSPLYPVVPDGYL